MERIVALVEGHTEFHFIKSIYGNAIVQRPFPNGDAVSIKLIIESIIDALETVGGNVTKVLIMLDREKRSETVEVIRCEILHGLENKVSNRRIYIALADRQIENWIMADENFIRNQFNNHSYSYAGDGSGGKAQLQKVCEKVSLSPSALTHTEDSPIRRDM